MARPGGKFDTLVRRVSSLQERYEEVSDMKKAVMAGTLALFRGRGEVLDIGYEEGYADIYRDMGFRVVPFNLPSDMHYDLNGSYERVICRHVLEHSICPALVLGNIYDVLVDGGEAIIVVPESSDFMAQHVGHYTVLRSDGWKRLFDLVGFNLVYEDTGKWDEHPAYVEMRFKVEK